MHLVAQNTKEVFTNPLSFSSNALSASDHLGAPSHIVTINVHHPEFCQTRARCETYEQAMKLQDWLDDSLMKLKNSIHVPNILKTQNPYPSKIVSQVDGLHKVTLQVYIVKRFLPIGRNKKEALTDPLENWDMNHPNPTFENQTLRLRSAFIHRGFKNKKSWDKKYKRMEQQGFIKCVEQNGLFRAKLRFLKAPNITYERDRKRINIGLHKPLGESPKALQGYEVRDMFNRDVILVGEEGTGRTVQG